MLGLFSLDDALALLNLIKRISSRVTENRETKKRLRMALTTFPELESALENAIKNGKRFESMVIRAPEPVRPVDSEEMYAAMANFFREVANSLRIFLEFARQAKQIVRNESFMERVKKLDPVVQELLIRVASNFDGLKYDSADTGILLALYGPTEFTVEETRDYVETEVKPLLEKVKRISPLALPPNRKVVDSLKRELMDIKRLIRRYKVNKKTCEIVMRDAPPWLGVMLGAAQENLLPESNKLA